MRFKAGPCVVDLSMSFLIFTAAALILDQSGVVPWGILAAVTHEMGHVLCLCAMKRPPARLRATWAGFRMDVSGHVARGYGAECLVAAAGPAVNLALSGVLLLLMRTFRWDVLALCATVQFVVGVFNLLPIAPLDGGRIVYALVGMFLDEGRARIVSLTLSFIILLPIATLGFMILLQTRYNISLLLCALYLVILMLVKT